MTDTTNTPAPVADLGNRDLFDADMRGINPGVSLPVLNTYWGSTEGKLWRAALARHASPATAAALPPIPLGISAYQALDGTTQSSYRAPAANAAALPEAAYTVGRNRCTCHPETCCCADWAVFGADGKKHSTYIFRETADETAAALNRAPATSAGDLPDLLPPMGVRNDRDMLDYLMVAFDNEIGTCERCGYSEPTKNMDSASFLRTYLAAAPRPAAKGAAGLEGGAA